MNKLIYLVLSVFLCTSLKASQLEELLPANTLFCLKVQNTAELKKLQKDNPITELSNNPDFKLYIDWLFNEVEAPNLTDLFAEMQEEIGVDQTRFEELFPGQALMSVSITNIDKLIQSMLLNDGDPSPFITVNLILEHKNNRKEITEIINKLLAESPDQEISKEEIHAATVYSRATEATGTQEPQMYVALSDSKFIFSLQKPSLVKILEKNASISIDTSLLESETYTKVLQKCSGNDLLFYINAGPISQIISEAIKSALSPEEGEMPNPMLPSPEIVLQALSLESLESIYASLSLTEENILIKSGLFQKEQKGLLKLLQYKNTSFEKPLFVPEHATQLAIINFSVSNFIQELEQIAFQAYPMANMMYQSYLMQLNSQAQIDIRNSLLQSLGELMHVYSIEPDEGQTIPINKTVIAIELKDTKKFELTLNKILELTGQVSLMTHNTFMEETIYNIANTSGLEGYENSYAILNNMLLIGFGNKDILNPVISQIKDPNKSVWDKKSYTRIWDELKTEDVCALQIIQFDSYINQILEIASQNIAAEKAFEEEEIMSETPPPPPAPKLDLDWFIIGESSMDESGLHNETRLLK